MEYFIIEDSESFGQIRQILAERAAAGVDVRLMYDDIGSVGYASLRFAHQLRKQGIRVDALALVESMSDGGINFRQD